MKILKSRKSNDGLIPYQLIALFSMYYTFLEKVIYNQINHVILNTILVKKVGFSTGRSCSVQILALIIFIDANFQNYLKIAAVIVNLSAPYNTVQRQGHLHKFFRIIHYQNIVQLINNMLANRSFKYIWTRKPVIQEH